MTLAPVGDEHGLTLAGGAVGAVVGHLDEHRYRVRYPNGGTAVVARDSLAVRAQMQRAGLQHDGEAPERTLYDHVIYSLTRERPKRYTYIRVG